MKFSVIIPCYNSSKTILPLLERLNQQSSKDFEVLLIDDCSKDNTIALVQSFIDTHTMNIKLIQKEKNSGPGISRNIGIQQAQGEYLCFMDSDDMISNNYFYSILKTLEIDYDVIYFNCGQIIKDKEFPSSLINFPDIKDYTALSSGSLCMFCSKRALWSELSLPEISNAEDIAVIPVIMSRAKKIITLPDILYYYIHYPTSLSNRYNPSVYKNFLKSFNYTLQYIDFKKYSSQIEFHGIKTVLYGATLNALKANVEKDCIEDFWKSFTKSFPKWYNNQYLMYYPFKKRLFLFFVRYRLLFFLKCYSSLHSFMLKRR